MLRTWDYAWWKPVVGILLVHRRRSVRRTDRAAARAGGRRGRPGRRRARSSTGSSTPRRSRTSRRRRCSTSTSTLASLTLVAFLVVRVVHRLRPALAVLGAPRHPLEVLLRLPRPRGRGADRLARSSASLLPHDPNELSGTPSFPTGQLLATAIVILLTTPLQALGEEYGFRGYLMQAFGSLIALPGGRAAGHLAAVRAGPRRAELPAVLRPVRLRPDGRPGRDPGRRPRGRHRAAHPEQPARVRRRDRSSATSTAPSTSPRCPGGSCP